MADMLGTDMDNTCINLCLCFNILKIIDMTKTPSKDTFNVQWYPLTIDYVTFIGEFWTNDKIIYLSVINFQIIELKCKNQLLKSKYSKYNIHITSS